MELTNDHLFDGATIRDYYIPYKKNYIIPKRYASATADTSARTISTSPTTTPVPTSTTPTPTQTTPTGGTTTITGAPTGATQTSGGTTEPKKDETKKEEPKPKTTTPPAAQVTPQEENMLMKHKGLVGGILIGGIGGFAYGKNANSLIIGTILGGAIGVILDMYMQKSVVAQAPAPAPTPRKALEPISRTMISAGSMPVIKK